MTRLDTFGDAADAEPEQHGEAVIRAVYRALDRRDLSLLGAMLADDVVWRARAEDNRADATLLAGRDKILSYVSDCILRSDGTLSVYLQRIYAGPSGYNVAFDEVTTAERPGVLERCVLYRVRNGLLDRASSLIPVRVRG